MRIMWWTTPSLRPARPVGISNRLCSSPPKGRVVSARLDLTVREARPRAESRPQRASNLAGWIDGSAQAASPTHARIH
eukprot:7946547-Pyramimonas_sp.AAC.2